MISNTIQQACDDIINEELKNQFPLSIWQTVSGIQTNINVNEVIANRSIEILGNKTPVDPIHHVNKNQSSNHTFSTGKEFCCIKFVMFFLTMHIAAILQLNDGIYSVLKHFQNVLKNKSEEFSGYIDQISMNIEALKTCQSRLYQLAIDDTVVPEL